MQTLNETENPIKLYYERFPEEQDMAEWGRVFTKP